jgi:AcrR family transcriptional regulator
MAKKRVRDKDQKINKVLRTSLKLLLTKGYNKITTNYIAEKAGVAIGTLYKYFPDGKSDILKGIFKMSIEERLEEFESDKIDKIDLNHIEDLRNSTIYKKTLLQNISEHRQYKTFIEAYETEILTNKKFYQEIREAYYAPSVYDVAVKKVLSDGGKALKFLKDQFFRISLIKEILIHRYVLFPDMFESDEEIADIIIEIFIALANYYLKKRGGSL